MNKLTWWIAFFAGLCFWTGIGIIAGHFIDHLHEAVQGEAPEMSTWEQAMKVAETKAFATRERWWVLGHRGSIGWCYHPWNSSMGFFEREHSTPPRERH